MLDWCKSCGRFEGEHGEVTHPFVSSLDGVFGKAEKKEADVDSINSSQDAGFVSVSKARNDILNLRLSKKQELTYQIFELMDKGMSKRGIADTLGVAESTIRNILAEAIPEASLEREISEVLNRHSAENGSNTPDFILAEYLMGCLKAFNLAANRRKEFHAGGVIDEQG